MVRARPASGAIAAIGALDVDAYHERVRAAGAEVLEAPADEPWGMREIGIRTVDGHRILLGQALR